MNKFTNAAAAITRLSLFGVIVLMLTTCLDEIELGQGEALPDGIVFQGRINAGNDGIPTTVAVRLERLFIAMGSNRPDLVITAMASIENSEGQSRDLLFVDNAYRATIEDNDPDFRVEPGLGYRVRVLTRQGEEFLTEFDFLPLPLTVEEAGAELTTIEVENQVGVNMDVPAIRYDVTAPVRYPDGSPTFIRFTLERTFKVTDMPTIPPFSMNDPKVCYVSRALDGNNLVLFSSLETTADRVEDFLLTNDRVDSEYAEGYVMTVFQEAISRPAYDYFDQVNRIASRESSLFEPPAGPVAGNAFDVNGNTSNVFGFFYATNRTQRRIAVSPEEAGNPTNLCPLPPSMSPVPTPNDCDDCGRINGSSLERPEWFPF